MILEELTEENIEKFLMNDKVSLSGHLKKINPKNEEKGYSLADFNDRIKIVLVMKRWRNNNKCLPIKRRVIFGRRDLAFDCAGIAGEQRVGMLVEYPELRMKIKSYTIKDILSAYEVV